MNNLLSLLIFIPALGAGLIGVSLALPLRKEQRDQLARWIALVASAISCLIGIYLWITYDGSAVGKIQFLERSIWIPSLNIEYFVGVDGISVSLVILSTLISFIATIASMPWWAGRHEHHDPAHPHFSVVKVPGYMTMLLFLQTGMSGTFAALDMFLFFVFWEVMLLPMYFLIGIWGGPRKEYAAIKFFLYTLGGSVLLLLAIISLYYHGPKVPVDGQLVYTFDLIKMAEWGRAGGYAAAPLVMGLNFMRVAWVALFIGFAVKIPMFPFHT